MRSEANLNVQKSKATGPAIILDSKYLIPSMFRGYIHCRATLWSSAEDRYKAVNRMVNVILALDIKKAQTESVCASRQLRE